MARHSRNTLLCLIFLSVLALTYFSIVSRQSHDLSGFYAATAYNNGPSSSMSKHLVVAAMDGDDTTWIQRRLPEWSSSVYTTNNPRARLTIPTNKGREAMVYLTYLIDNYHALPSIILFIHGLQYQWHNDDPNYDTATVVSRVQIPHVLSEGYANLRCVWDLGCPNEIRVNTPMLENPSERHYREGFQQLFPGRELPELVGASCCAQFALSREQARKVPLEEYKRIRRWLVETRFEDEVSGRIMEYSWHILFGRDAVHCPDAKSCYCNVFGLCELMDCTQGECGRYYMPPIPQQPSWWEEDPALAVLAKDL